MPEDLLAVFLHERGNDLRIAHAGLLHAEDFGASGLAEMALARGHHAVDVLRASAALTGKMRADPLYLVAFKLRFRLRKRGRSQNQKKKTTLQSKL
jgi:hypothetical protein